MAGAAPSPDLARLGAVLETCGVARKGVNVKKGVPSR
jgi:hypothetical protein